MVPMVLINKRFPSFVNSVWLPDEKYVGNQETGALKPIVEDMLGTFYGISELKYLFAFYDGFMCFNSWQPIAAFDIAVTMVSRILANALDRMHTAVMSGTSNVDEIFKLYNSLRILIHEINLAFGGILFVQEMMTLVCHVTSLFAALQTSGTWISLFFIHVSITFLVKMYLVYLPFVQVFHKSIQLRDDLKKRRQGTSGENFATNYRTGVEKKAETMRNLCVRPLGLHRLTHVSITDYVFAVFSYVVTIKKT